MQKLELQRIGAYYKISLQERETPTDEDVAKVAGLRLIAMLEGSLRDKTNLEKERMKRFIPLLKELAQDDEQLLLAAQLLDDLYQQTLHTPPPAPEAAKEKKQAQNSQKEQNNTQGQQRRHTRPRRRKPTRNSAD
jgi:ATP-dependent RNA helicase DeaD